MRSRSLYNSPRSPHRACPSGSPLGATHGQGPEGRLQLAVDQDDAVPACLLHSIGGQWQRVQLQFKFQYRVR